MVEFYLVSSESGGLGIVYVQSDGVTNSVGVEDIVNTVAHLKFVKDT